jgi:hypothetical protein
VEIKVGFFFFFHFLWNVIPHFHLYNLMIEICSLFISFHFMFVK